MTLTAHIELHAVPCVGNDQRQGACLALIPQRTACNACVLWREDQARACLEVRWFLAAPADVGVQLDCIRQMHRDPSEVWTVSDIQARDVQFNTIAPY